MLSSSTSINVQEAQPASAGPPGTSFLLEVIAGKSRWSGFRIHTRENLHTRRLPISEVTPYSRNDRQDSRNDRQEIP
jgi:hypothetical protein